MLCGPWCIRKIFAETGLWIRRDVTLLETLVFNSGIGWTWSKLKARSEYVELHVSGQTFILNAPGICNCLVARPFLNRKFLEIMCTLGLIAYCRVLEWQLNEALVFFQGACAMSCSRLHTFGGWLDWILLLLWDHVPTLSGVRFARLKS